MTASEWINNNDDVLLLVGIMAIFTFFVLLFIWGRHEGSKDKYASGGYIPNNDTEPAGVVHGSSFDYIEWEEHERQERIQEMVDFNKSLNETQATEAPPLKEQGHKIMHNGRQIGYTKSIIFACFVYTIDDVLVCINDIDSSVSSKEKILRYLSKRHQKTLTRLRYGIKGE